MHDKQDAPAGGRVTIRGAGADLDISRPGADTAPMIARRPGLRLTRAHGR